MCVSMLVNEPVSEPISEQLTTGVTELLFGKISDPTPYMRDILLLKEIWEMSRLVSCSNIGMIPV